MGDRIRITGEKVLAEGQSGPIRYKLIARGPAVALFSVRERTAMLRACAQRMGDFWIAVFLPKRFESAYATGKLGYHVSRGYAYKKEGRSGGAEPLVWSGDLKQGMQDATAKGMAGPKGPAVTIRLPTPGHVLAAIVQQVLNTIPAFEVAAMAGEFDRRLGQILRGSDSTDPTRSKLTMPQRASFGLGTSRGRPAGTYSRAGRAA